MDNWRVAYRTLLLTVALALAVVLKEVLLLAFLGVLLGVVFSFPVRLFSRIMPRGLAVLLTLVLSGALVAGISLAAYQPLSDQVGQLRTHIPEAIDRAEAWLRREQRESPIGQVTQGQSVTENVRSKVGSLAGLLASATGKIAVSATSVLAGLIVIIVLGAFLAHEPDSYKEGLLALVPRNREDAMEGLWLRLMHGLRHWVGGILVSMTIMGTLAAIGLALLGVQDWFLLGVLTFFGTFVPYLGAISSAVPGLLLALAQSPTTFLGAIGVYLGVHIVEGYIVQPFVMKRAVVIRPAALLVWQLVMGTLAGLLGIIVATPLLACLQITVGYLYVERGLGKEAAPVGGVNRAA